jgi:tetratricopeptide (TPR) repeat protein
MITNKYTLLAGIVIIMAQVVWGPALWSITESGGLHWWLIRLPLVLSIPIGIGLFLSSIENKGAYRQAVLSAMDSGDFKRAVAILDNAIESNPQDAGLYRSKALALMFAGRDAEAKTCIEQSLSIEPNDQQSEYIARILEDVGSGKRSRPESMKEV